MEGRDGHDDHGLTSNTAESRAVLSGLPPCEPVGAIMPKASKGASQLLAGDFKVSTCKCERGRECGMRLAALALEREGKHYRQAPHRALVAAVVALVAVVVLGLDMWPVLTILASPLVPPFALTRAETKNKAWQRQAAGKQCDQYVLQGAVDCTAPAERQQGQVSSARDETQPHH